MTANPSENFLPIYENLVRERGDAVAEAHLAAEHTHHQAVALLGPEHFGTRTEADVRDQLEQRGPLR
ncbi:hypothetical protein [Streptomyces justiciae]|uniref:hypothetical protein n=1 Tax=Streptomyces justiciae TaxID=2780140 RepID=UPI0018807643|nr:hypothetical protein [Streptomyces justiciae]MBE8472269.1 hypothetical protein [Streptomyces justiciae]